MAIDCKEKKNHVLFSHVDVGFAANSACKTLSGVEVLRFKEECLTFLQHVSIKLAAKCPIQYKLVKGATCLNPSVVQSEVLRAVRITTALEVFVDKKRMEPGVADVVKREYIALCEKESVRGMLTGFKRDNSRLDVFLNQIMVQENASASLKTFVLQILTLFHGNAAVQKSFSINKECLVENLHNDSLIA
jgi:hypothetical protein